MLVESEMNALRVETTFGAVRDGDGTQIEVSAAGQSRALPHLLPNFREFKSRRSGDWGCCPQKLNSKPPKRTRLGLPHAAIALFRADILWRSNLLQDWKESPEPSPGYNPVDA